MGSGDRVSFSRNQGFAIGIGGDRFPFAVTLWLNLGFWSVQVGFGKAYDDTTGDTHE